MVGDRPPEMVNNFFQVREGLNLGLLLQEGRFQASEWIQGLRVVLLDQLALLCPQHEYLKEVFHVY